MRLIRTLTLVLVASLAAGTAVAQPDPARTLQELLDQVREHRERERAEWAEREQRFLEERDRQAERLEAAQAALAAEEARNEELLQAHRDNRERIQALEAELDEELGELGELTGTVRRVAGDVEGMLESSLITAQFPGRLDGLRALTEIEDVPSIRQLESMWLNLHEEITRSGEVVRFPARITTAEGDKEDTVATRVGVFTVVADGRFLRYLPEARSLVELGRQPPQRQRRLAADLEAAEAGLVPMPVDPSRGALLALLVEAPDLRERIQQGGVVGYVILALGGIGLLIALERLFVLYWIGRRVRRQLRQEDEPSADNPLGRIIQVYHGNTGQDAETLGLKLDEAVLKELPRVRRGLPTLAILAAVAPLLGLLGTVMGMIETFQAITLFGTGDPQIMSGGISEALVTTALGLVVAVPILLLHSFLSSKSNSLIQTLDEQSAALVARAAEAGHARGSG